MKTKNLINLMFRLFLLMNLFSIVFTLPVYGDDLVGKEAPTINGKKAIGRGLLKLDRLMTDFFYKKEPLNGNTAGRNRQNLVMVKNVVVMNFFSTTCIPCIKEIPTYNRLAEKYRDDPVRFIYVNVDESADLTKIRRLIAKKNIKVPMMLPNQKEAIRKYHVVSLPRIVVINRKGKIEQILVGLKDDLEEELSRIIDPMLI